MKEHDECERDEKLIQNPLQWHFDTLERHGISLGRKIWTAHESNMEQRANFFGKFETEKSCHSPACARRFPGYFAARLTPRPEPVGLKIDENGICSQKVEKGVCILDAPSQSESIKIVPKRASFESNKHRFAWELYKGNSLLGESSTFFFVRYANKAFIHSARKNGPRHD